MPSPSPPRDEEPSAKPDVYDSKPEPRPERARTRSRSPRRSPPRKPKNFSGLKWKNDKRDDRSGRDGERQREERDRYRDRAERRDRNERHHEDRFERRDRDDRSSRSDRDRRGEAYRDRDRDRRDDRRRDDRYSDRRGGRNDRDDQRNGDRNRNPKPPPAIASTGEAMIIVTVNDRLGTKTQVPCLPSDPVKVLKAMVAAKIGRPVHEIMLKRQGERPFHDQLSLADYSISNGVQIDLELNTGD